LWTLTCWRGRRTRRCAAGSGRSSRSSGGRRRGMSCRMSRMACLRWGCPGQRKRSGFWPAPCWRLLGLPECGVEADREAIIARGVLPDPAVVAAHQKWDIEHVQAAGIFILMLPCGNDSHVELGIALAAGADVYILGEPERPGIFYHGATVCRDEDALLAVLRRKLCGSACGKGAMVGPGWEKWKGKRCAQCART